MTMTLEKHVAQPHEMAIRREYPALLAFCRTLDWNSPEDLAQEATARTLQRLAAHEIDNIGAYLRTTARHVRADIVRAKYAHPVVVTDELDDDPTEDRDVVQDMANHEAIVRALSLLNERERRVLRLAELDELSIEAIAGVLDTSPSAATSVLYRARRKLRREVEKLKARGMLAMAGPVGAIRELFSGGGAQIAAGAATALIAVAASIGLLGQVGAQPTAAPAVAVAGAPVNTSLAVNDAVADFEPAPSNGARSPKEPLPGIPGTPAAAPQEQPGGRPFVRPRPPDPAVFREPQDDKQKKKPVYIAAPEADVDCDGTADVYIVLSDDPWAESGGAVFDGTPPPGMAGSLVHVDASKTETPPGCRGS